MSLLVESLVLVCQILLVPVVASLFVMATIRLLDLGGFVREWWERRRSQEAWVESARRLADSGRIDRESAEESLLDVAKALPSLVGEFVSRSEQDAFHHLLVEKHANDCEIKSLGRLARLSFSVRVCPILGLMGTLIPLGPSLLSLSSGDIATMSEQLAIAFGTTVLGLLIGGIAYGQWLVRRQWYARDLADIDFIRQCIAIRRKGDS